MTPDGRFVLFASTAANLVSIETNSPIPAVIPTPLNVYLRDRLSGTTHLISVNTDGSGGANADSLPMGVSTNGRYALFESSASNLVQGDTNNASDVFVRDVLLGTTLLASVATNGGSADDSSYNSVMTPDGRYVAFASVADNLVLGDTNGIPDVFVRDMTSNVTTIVSAGAQNRSVGYLDPGSDYPVITPDGLKVAFLSTAGNLAPGVPTFMDVYVHDMAAKTNTWASVGALAALQSIGNATNAVSFSQTISADGRYVAFQATQYPLPALSPTVVLRYDLRTGLTELVDANAVPVQGGLFQNVQNLAMTPDGRFVAYVANAIDTSGTTTAIRLWDGQSGTNIAVSVNSTNGIQPGSQSDSPFVDDSGRFVAFLSSAPDLVTNQLQGDFHLYLRDLQTGLTTLLDANPNGVGSLIDPDATPVISTNGLLAAFDSPDTSLVARDRNHAYDVFVHNVQAGTIELVSPHDPGLPCVTADGESAIGSACVSSDGRWIAFWSDADDLTGNDTNALRDVYLHDAASRTNWLVSFNTNGVAGDGLSTDLVISADGRFAAFTSLADDLVNGDTNQAQDVFVAAVPQGIPSLVSVNYTGTGPGNSDSFSPVLSSNGQFVLFHSLAGNLVPGMSGGTENLFWRDLQSNTTYALTTNGVTSASMTPDGRLIAFVTSSVRNLLGPLSDRLYIWDSQTLSLVYAQTGAGFATVTISLDGQRVAYETNSSAGWKQLSVLDRRLNTNWIISAYRSSSSPPPQFSADGQFLAYEAGLGVLPVTNHIFLFDFQAFTNLLISQSFDGSGPADDNSDSAQISSDARFIAYRSAADNLVPGDTNGVPDIFLYDRLNGATTLLTTALSGNGNADNRSLTPFFSENARTLVFVSWASNLLPGDFNNNSDVFALDLYGRATVIPLSATISPAQSGNWLTWPVVSGKLYRVQFKNNLSDSSWQELIGPISIVGSQASFNDRSASSGSRFYRVLAFNL